MKQEKLMFETNRQGRFGSLIGWAVDLVVVIALALFLVLMFGEKESITGKSMQPILEGGDTVLVNRMLYKFTKPDRLDVIAFDGKDDQVYVKRIVGLPGERIQIRKGEILINGEAIEVPDTMRSISLAGLAEQEIFLAKNEYFVLGDNPDTSEDSRFAQIGNIRRDKIKGKVWIRMLPYRRLGLIH